MKKNNLIILILLFNSIVYSQNTVQYNYIISNKPYKNKPYVGMELEFSAQKKCLSEFEFSISRLFTGNQNFIDFKQKNQVLYYKNKKRWVLFYDFETKKGGDISISGIKYHLFFKEKIKIRNITLDKIYLKATTVTQLHQRYYYINKNEGVLAIKTSIGKMLIRDDFFKEPLSEEEEKLLN
ncbi:hypothetical protein QLS31_01600 [Flavobacterium sp. XS2P24]|uniref:hypothetical protein n=1 Tax=Flavobacterium sp. XS2P24 TaxID=3041249 RepID=UPI0024A8148E|nr:hypothetical protein [Flavobacterium sp. XS2P24]MDI6048518.1 hypothetical protein [Flavobacterium sp. XS2P24]